ncbi:MAG: hypothetical protein L0H84_04280 [Pseudonocardia sp.]|nr:hypothetical protein [Pseudonocardia sp.]
MISVAGPGGMTLLVRGAAITAPSLPQRPSVLIDVILGEMATGSSITPVSNRHHPTIATCPPWRPWTTGTSLRQESESWNVLEKGRFGVTTEYRGAPKHPRAEQRSR